MEQKIFPVKSFALMNTNLFCWDLACAVILWNSFHCLLYLDGVWFFSRKIFVSYRKRKIYVGRGLVLDSLDPENFIRRKQKLSNVSTLCWNRINNWNMLKINTSFTFSMNRRGYVEVEHSPRMREIGVRSPVATYANLNL